MNGQPPPEPGSASPPPRGSRRSPRRTRFKVAAGALGLLVACVVGEVVVRIVAPQRSYFTGGSLFMPDPDVGFRLRPNVTNGEEVTINSQGLRDVERPLAKPEGVRRVLVLGDSFTFAAVPLEESFVRRLSAALGPTVDVVNAGVPAWSTAQQAAWLRKFGLAYEPDVIVVAFFVGNDIVEALGHDQFTVEDDELVPKEDKRRERSFLRRLRNKSHLYRLFRGLPEEVFYRLLGDSPARRRYHKIERRRLGVCAVGEAAETWEPGWQEAREKLAEIRELAGPRPVVLFVIPDEFQVSRSLREGVFERYDLDPADYDLDLPQRRIAAWAEELGFELVDCLEPCRARTDAGEVLYIPNDSHWNAAGNRLGAELLGRAPALRALAR